MKYRAIIATRKGAPQVFEIVANGLRSTSAGVSWVRILTTGVCQDDVIAMAIERLESGQAIGNIVLSAPELL